MFERLGLGFGATLTIAASGKYCVHSTYNRHRIVETRLAATDDRISTLDHPGPVAVTTTAGAPPGAGRAPSPLGLTHGWGGT